ncbi:MAG: VOC family protein [bacterium]|nr:VOC family protein [bacterium]
MHNKSITRQFYLNQLGFKELPSGDYDGYLMVEKDQIEIHFFEFTPLDSKENYGQVYNRTNNIEKLYQEFLINETAMHPNGKLEIKPWQ